MNCGSTGFILDRRSPSSLMVASKLLKPLPAVQILSQLESTTHTEEKIASWYLAAQRLRASLHTAVMNKLTRIFGLAFTLVSLVLAQTAIEVPFDWDSVQPSDALNWVDCFTELQCARFNVPLNYSDTSAGAATLAMIRIPSNLSTTDENYRGPILFNPGGPGVSGVDAMVTEGKQLATLFGPEFDIVSFDPRGVGRSTPQLAFFSSEVEKAFWDLNDPAVNSVNVSTIADGIPRLWAHSQILGQLARDHDTGILPHLTSDNVARDMLKIVEEHNRTNINFYGISYGTALGATFAAMFPDRIERMILDGVLETTGYYSGDWSAQLDDTDKSLQLFFDSCFTAGPSACAFHANASSPDEIKSSFFNLLESVRLNPIPVYNGPSSAYGIVDFASVKSAVQVALGSPYTVFPVLAQGLALLATGNGSVIFQLTGQEVYGTLPANVSALNAPYTVERQREAEIAISCTDMLEITDGPEDLLTYFESIKNVSTFVDLLLPQRTHCSGWQVNPDHFIGPITGNTSVPILFIGNTADPVTPVSAAKTMSEKFPGSVVLTQDSGGHTSLAAPSACTAGHIQDYVRTGTLPPQDTVCPIDVQLFSQAPPTILARSAPSLAQKASGVIGKRRLSKGY
ncbi:alpha beta hydrolase fold family [Moniliophthora roreri MCA 2997]|uniref:Alpha beta hydrolase fold family n=1 Tax=Moniliophthora roreri (strain MCA 2997) TaxID=1381753 RepID=V2WYL1_MONRO|nr:alpha beta hydrolase fold family [Moniliophthora roreri MCA 2997]